MSFNKCEKWWSRCKHSIANKDGFGKLAMPVAVFDAWVAGSLEYREKIDILKQDIHKLEAKVKAKNSALMELCTCTDGGVNHLRLCKACQYRNFNN